MLACAEVVPLAIRDTVDTTPGITGMDTLASNRPYVKLNESEMAHKHERGGVCMSRQKGGGGGGRCNTYATVGVCTSRQEREEEGGCAHLKEAVYVHRARKRGRGEVHT